MEKFESVEAVLDFAIAREQEAVDFYGVLAVQTDQPLLKKTLVSFAAVEQGHKEKLMAAKKGDIALSEERGGGLDLKISDYLVDVEAGPEMSFQDALVVAMKREKAAMDLYTDLVAMVSDPALQSLFKKLAHEEGTHKLRFESLYEDCFLGDN